MAFADHSDLPVFLLADLARQTRNVLLTPAVRWRVIIEQVEAVEHDILLETVVNLRAAGVTSSDSIADLLQLPEGLIRHLLAQTSANRMTPTDNGQLQTSASKVAWIYRDIATGELWPDPTDERPAIHVDFDTPHRGRFNRGTPGRPDQVYCLVLETAGETAAEPTSIELARFSTGLMASNHRTALVSSGERCLVASPVAARGDGYTVETTRDVPHLSLTRLLAIERRNNSSIDRWLKKIPRIARPEGEQLPLQSALNDLTSLVGMSAEHASNRDRDSVLSHLEVCLSRFADQYRYAYAIDSEVTDAPVSADSLTVYGLDFDTCRCFVTANPRSTCHRIAQLLLAAAGKHPSEQLAELAQTTAAWAALAAGASRTSLEVLLKTTIAMSERLLDSTEDDDGQQGR